MPVIKYTDQIVQQPRTLIYGPPGSGKSSLFATLGPDVLFACTEGGLQSISHLRRPYIDLLKPKDWDEMIKYFRAGKRENGGIRCTDGKWFNGLVIDLYGETVQIALIDLVRNSQRVLTGGASVDDPSEYEYKKLNFQIIRQLKEIRSLPLRHVGLTAYVQEWKDKMGSTTSIRPEFVGTKIVNSVLGQVDYCFYLEPPRNAAKAKAGRVIRTQPTQIITAKSRVPGVAGNIPLPAEIDYPLGHPDLLLKIYAKVDEIIAGQRKLEPKAPIPTEVVETVTDDETDSKD